MTGPAKSAPVCQACQRPVADNARLCALCSSRLERDIGEVGALAHELQTTRLRQSRTGGAATGVLSRSSDRPLPWNQHAAEAADTLRSTVVAWVRVVLEERGGRLPADTLHSMGLFLLEHLEWLRHHPDADECADEIGHAVRLARRTIDLVEQKVYAGPCREDIDETTDAGPACCVAELYVRKGAPAIVCPHCAAEHDVAARHRWLLAIADDQLVTAADLSRFLSAYGEPLTAERIRQWASRRHGDAPPLLLARGKDRSGRPLYRVADAVAVLAKMGSTRGRRRSA